MSKQIKQMEMDSLRKTFEGVRDMVLLTASKVDAQVENQIRLGLRKKNIRLQMVKNSLVRRVFGELGVQTPDVWEGPTLLAWGADSLASLSKEIDTLLRKSDKIKAKGAVSEGQPITFQQALEMPTREEAIARVVALALAPAARLLSQILAPASRVAAQIKTLSERTEAESTEPAPA